MGTLNPDLLTEELTHVMNRAVEYMDRFHHTVLSAEAVLYAMLEDGSNAAVRLLHRYEEERGLDLDRLSRQVRLAAQRRRAQNSDMDFLGADGQRTRLSNDMIVALDEGLSIAQAANEVYVNTDHLLFGMAERRTSTSGILRQHGILPKATPRQAWEDETPAAGTSSTAVDHVALAKAGKFPPVYFRDALLRDMVNILSQTENRHLLLVGPDGVGKRTLAISLALLIAEGNGPAGVDKLVQIEETALLDNPLAAIQAGLKRATGGILFIPHIQRFFGGLIKAGEFHKVAPKVQKAFHNDAPILIGTTNDVEYNARIAGVPAVIENSQVLRVPETDEAETIEILRTLKPHLEVDYELEIVDDALRLAASMAKRYLSGTPLPRAAEQLLHRTSAVVNSAHTGQSAAAADDRVDAEDVTLTVSQMTGVPVSKLGVDERTRYASMVEHLHERIIGQEEAVQAVSRAVKTARVGLKDPKRPIGSFLFLGPTGVGKSELAKALAEFMFGSEDAMLQLDMSEFQDESTINRLIGSPSGYIDSEAGGQLTERVRQQPYLIVLFDEVEKAHPRVLDILLQVMEEGRLTDGRGNVANFSETVIIMTSNLGARHLVQSDIVDESGHILPEVREQVMDAVDTHFRPEFLNRLSEIVVFHPLNDDHLYKILGLMLRKDQKLAAGRGITLEFTEWAKRYMLGQNEHPEWGARPLRRIIDRHVREPLADFMLKENPGPGTTILVNADEDGMFFEMT